MRPRSVEFTLDNIQYQAVAAFDDVLGVWNVAEVTGLNNAGDVRRIPVEIVADDAITALEDATNEIVGRHLRGELSAR